MNHLIDFEIELEQSGKMGKSLHNPSTWMHTSEDLSKKQNLLGLESGLIYQKLTETYFEENHAIKYQNMVSNSIRKHYPDIGSGILKRIEKHDMGLLSHSLIRASYSKKLAQKIMQHRDKLFSRLSFESRKYFTPRIIDITDISYMSYDTLDGMLSYAHSVNKKNYTLNADAERLFKGLLSKGVFDAKGANADINLLFAGLSLHEMAWAYDINRRNKQIMPRTNLEGIDGRQLLGEFSANYPNNITVIDSSLAASTLHNMFSGEIIPPSNKILSLYEVHDYLRNLPKARKQIIMKHNGLSCETLEDNLREMEVLRYALDGKDSAIFYTIPTTESKTKISSYAGKDVLFPYATLKTLLLLDDAQIDKFKPRVITQNINHDSFRYMIGFDLKEKVDIIDQHGEKRLVLPQNTFLGIHSSNRYGRETVHKMAEISKRKLFGRFEEGMQALY